MKIKEIILESDSEDIDSYPIADIIKIVKKTPSAVKYVKSEEKLKLLIKHDPHWRYPR